MEIKKNFWKWFRSYFTEDPYPECIKPVSIGVEALEADNLRQTVAAHQIFS